MAGKFSHRAFMFSALTIIIYKLFPIKPDSLFDETNLLERCVIKLYLDSFCLIKSFNFTKIKE